ncbi:unnamed protein product [Orchesella dallaii]|uniref:Uncharacterized protein n=1 Tax=Orchesella dallaii TaxID=48710 RepID=A0ABP1Q3B6_9HEXA
MSLLLAGGRIRSRQSNFPNIRYTNQSTRLPPRRNVVLKGVFMLKVQPHNLCTTRTQLKVSVILTRTYGGLDSDELIDRRRDTDGPISQFGTTVGNHRLSVLQEDFPEIDGINSCTFVPETYETPTFDYYDYMEFNRLRMLLFHVDNRKNDILNRVDREIRDPEDVPSNEFLRSHIKKCYGEVDLESKQILGGLEVLKEYLIEQARD